MGGRHELNCRNRAHNQIWRDKKAEFFHHFQPDKNKICFTSLALWTLERVARLLRHLKSDGIKAKPHTAPRALSEAVTTIDSDWL